MLTTPQELLGFAAGLEWAKCEKEEDHDTG